MSARDVSAGSSRPSSIEEPDYFIRLALLAAIVESSDDAIVSKTLDGRILSWNAGASRIFGYTAEEVIGRPLPTIGHDVEDHGRLRDRVLRGESLRGVEVTRRRKDGTLVNISLSVAPLHDAAEGAH